MMSHQETHGSNEPLSCSCSSYVRTVMVQRTDRPFLMVFKFLPASDLVPAMQTSVEWLSTLDMECVARLAADFQRDDSGDVLNGRPKLAKARASRRFVELHRMIRASMKRLHQLLNEVETLDSMSTHHFFIRTLAVFCLQ